MKEREDAPEPVVVSTRTGPTPITATGLAALKRQLESATGEYERARLQTVIENATVVPPPDDRDTVGFGATVRVEGATPKPQTFTIVGDVEADPAHGKIGLSSPLAEALLGRHVGEAVVWRRPVGDVRVTLQTISYEDPA
jgi:transcription elongation factor GreB